MTSKQAYDAVVQLCRQQGWWATHTVITEEGRPDDGTDWNKLLTEWSNESKSTQQS